MKQVSHIIIFSILVLISSHKSVYSQEQKENNQYEINKAIDSKFLKETRNIGIHLPSSYYRSVDSKYPVLYILDAQNLLEHTLFIYKYLSQKGHIPEMILVSIPHTGKRNRDYKTFFRDTDKINKGADNFMSFIEKEVITLVDKDYRSTHYRMLSGHSNSGLFIMHSLIKNPKLFKARFAFSPSSHHIPKQRELLYQFLKRNKDLNSYFYMNVGGSEFYKMTDAFNEIRQMFVNYAPSGLRYDFDFLEVDGHQTSPFIGQHLAFKKLYDPLKLTIENYEEMSFDDLLGHFDSISLEFEEEIIPKEKELASMGNYFVNYEANLEVFEKVVKLVKHYYPQSKLLGGNILFYRNWLAYGINKKISYSEASKPDERVLNSMGYRYLSQNKYEEAIYILTLATELYAESANTYDSLGEAFEKSGNMRKALKMYKKAYALAKKENKKESIEIYIKNIKRAKNKL
ncbi:alpha/beta hydrolase-fold protein [Aquimarina sp. 2201CG5-10]|uniref:alpha/beta hydrolase-fold protein n=1 Tax=Aquimarina callyspongiae TaxID=3098150 RepID=UPI002AB58C80|nr:alpha/beta hydrolase-fold protein [Aquimarina sp. 2201CG5-10]MDY8134875.1 alpha/beta hydrolase-fold protein [Aquimarina sp. 2201CG5-10]